MQRNAADRTHAVCRLKRTLPAIVSVVAVVHSGARSEGNATQHLGEACLTHDEERLLCSYSRAGVGEAIVDDDETVGIRTGVAATADRGGDGPHGDSAVAIDLALYVAQ